MRQLDSIRASPISPLARRSCPRSADRQSWRSEAGARRSWRCTSERIYVSMPARSLKLQRVLSHQSSLSDDRRFVEPTLVRETTSGRPRAWFRAAGSIRRFAHAGPVCFAAAGVAACTHTAI